MENLEYLQIVKGLEKKYLLEVLIKNDITRHNDINDEYRKTKALEIIAEELVIFNRNFKSLIGGSVTHSIRTMSMMGG